MHKSFHVSLLVSLFSFAICNGFAMEDDRDSAGNFPGSKTVVVDLEKFQAGISSLLKDCQDPEVAIQQEARTFLFEDVKNLTRAALYFSAAYVLWQTDYYAGAKESVYVNYKTQSGFFKEEVNPYDRLTRAPSALALPSGMAGVYYLGKVSVINHCVIQPTQRGIGWTAHAFSNKFNALSIKWYELFNKDKGHDKKD